MSRIHETKPWSAVTLLIPSWAHASTRGCLLSRSGPLDTGASRPGNSAEVAPGLLKGGG